MDDAAKKLILSLSNLVGLKVKQHPEGMMTIIRKTHKPIKMTVVETIAYLKGYSDGRDEYDDE